MTFPRPAEMFGATAGAAERSISLFPTDRPLRPEELIGRDGDVAELAAGIGSGTPQLLTGGDKSGKTSVAAAAAAAFEQSGGTVVRVDLFRQPSLERLIVALTPGGEAGEQPTVGTAITRLDADAAERDAPTLLVIDSFHELVTTHIFGKPADTAKMLRAAISAASNLRCLLVGGAPSSLRNLYAKDQPLHRFGQITLLPDATESAWRAGLVARFEHGACALTDDAADLLVARGEGHARTTMLIAQHTYALAAGHRLPAADATVVEAGAASASAAEWAAAEHHVARIRTLSKHALTTVIRVAAGESPYKNLPPAMARQTLRLLEAAGVIDRPRSGSYRVVDPLLRRHVIASMDGEPAAAAAPSIQLLTVSSPMPAQPSPYDQAAEPLERTAEPSRDAVDDSARPPSAGTAPTPVAQPAPVAPSDQRHRAARGRAVVRHPTPDEASAIGDRIARALGATGDELRQRPGDAVATRISGFVRAAVANEPQRYWHVEIGDRAVGGVVLRAPGAMIGRGTATGIDPIGQAAFAAFTGVLLIAGLAMLVVRQAWNWGAFAGLIFAAFLAATVHLAMLAPRIASRAQASWAARRTGGHMVEALWNEPDALLPVFRELAQVLPGTHLNGCADTAAQATALREIGFCVQRNRVLDGVLDPDAARPVTAYEPAGRPEGLPRHARAERLRPVSRGRHGAVSSSGRQGSR